MLFLFFCPAAVYQQSFLGGEQTAASAAPTGTAEQHRDQQRKPIRLATFEFDFKKQRGNRRDSPSTEAARTSARAEWKRVDAPVEPRKGSPKSQQDCEIDEIDFANGNRRGKKKKQEREEEVANNNDGDNDDDNDNGDSTFLHSDCLLDMHSLSHSMRDLINNLNLNLNENKTSRCIDGLISRSAASSLNSIPENLNSLRDDDAKLATSKYNCHSNSSMHRSEKIAENFPETPRSHRGDNKNGNTKVVIENSDLESNGKKYNRKNLFDSDDFRNSNVSTATVSTSSESSLSHSSTGGNDIETSDSFVNIQFARLARDRKSSSTQSMESTDSFENVSFRYAADNGNDNNGRLLADPARQIPSKRTTHRGSHRVVLICNSDTKPLPQTRIAALNSISKSVKLDNQAEGKTVCSSGGGGGGGSRVQETNKCARNEPVKLRHERYIGRKGQVDSRAASKSKRYSCFSPCATKKSSAEEGIKVATRKFSSTDELREATAERQKPAASKAKRFSLYYTPQPSRKTYLEAETRSGRSACKSAARASKSTETSKSKDEEAERSRKSMADASTVASRSKSSRQNVHVRPSVANANLITSRTK